MSFFKKDKPGKPPAGCEGLEVRIESSTCTGEKTIGFFDPSTRRLKYTELVRSPEDITAFCERYGVKLKK